MHATFKVGDRVVDLRNRTGTIGLAVIDTASYCWIEFDNGSTGFIPKAELELLRLVRDPS